MEHRVGRGQEKNQMIDYSKYYEKIDNPYTVPTACVDGRKGSGLFAKLPGASLFFAVTEWALDKQQNENVSLSDQLRSTLEFYKQFIELGTHSDNHHENDPVDSGCGFADKIIDIVNTLAEKKDEIWQRLTTVAPALKYREGEWKQVVENINRKVSQFGELPKGREFTGSAKENGAEELILQDEHKEEAAVVNYKENYILNTDKAVDDGHPVFNLDMWYLINVLKQAGKSEEYINRAELFALGAFVATEMVLVENKGKPALPVIILQ